MFLLQIPLAFAQGASGASPSTGIADRVLACAPCHGAHGEGTQDPYFPRLAGKPAGYLTNQLLAFKDGRRRYPPMNYLIEFLPNDYLSTIANYFASQRPPLPPPTRPTLNADLLALGQKLVADGDVSREIPACSSCHGPGFTGMEPGIPGLLGLKTSYISAQLGAWRYGTRTAISPDCMQAVAARLTEDDVKSIAAYLSSLSAPAGYRPAPKGSWALPFACGSEPK